MERECPKCSTPMTFVRGGISKKTGRAYTAFFSCPNCKHTENASAKPEKEPEFDNWQKSKGAPTPNEDAQLIIAREAAGNALSRMYAGQPIPVDEMINMIDELASFYITGEKPFPPRET